MEHSTRCWHCTHPRAYWVTWAVFTVYWALARFLGSQAALVILVTVAALPLSTWREA